MISDLTNTELSTDDWGNKATRLSEASKLGLAIPAGICIQYAAALQSPASVGEALSAWIELYQPQLIVARMSSIREDQLAESNAGKTTSILDCTPDVPTLLRTLNDALLPYATPWASQGGGLSFIFQYQVRAQFGGVAFLIGDHLLVEGQRQSTNAVTAGDEPAVRMDITGADIRAEGTLSGWPVTNMADSIRTACSRLKNHFGFDVDVEWAWSGGVLYVLQVRPVTVSL